MTDIRSVVKQEAISGPKTMRGLIEQDIDKNVVRDSYIYFDFDESEGEAFQAGYSIVYPGCRTGGHSHDDLEEVYHIVRGTGLMTIGDDEFEVQPGDTYLVPRFQHHTFKNPGNMPVEYFWIVIKTE